MPKMANTRIRKETPRGLRSLRLYEKGTWTCHGPCHASGTHRVHDARWPGTPSPTITCTPPTPRPVPLRRCARDLGPVTQPHTNERGALVSPASQASSSLHPSSQTACTRGTCTFSHKQAPPYSHLSPRAPPASRSTPSGPLPQPRTWRGA